MWGVGNFCGQFRIEQKACCVNPIRLSDTSSLSLTEDMFDKMFLFRMGHQAKNNSKKFLENVESFQEEKINIFLRSRPVRKPSLKFNRC